MNYTQPGAPAAGGGALLNQPVYSSQAAGYGVPSDAPPSIDYSNVGKVGLNLLDPNERDKATPPTEAGGFFSGFLSSLGGTFGEGGRSLGQQVGKFLELPFGIAGAALGAVGSVPIPGGTEIENVLGGGLEALGLAKHGQAPPIIVSDLARSFGPDNPAMGGGKGVTLGGIAGGLLGVFGLLGRAVERQYAEGAVNPGQFLGRREPIPADLQAQIDAGTMSVNDALDTMVVRGQGYSDNPLANILLSIGLDPTTILTAGVGLTGKAAAATTKVERALQLAGELGQGEKISSATALSRIAAADSPGLRLSRLEHLGLTTVGRVPGFEQAVVPVANAITRWTDPMKLFGGGNIGRRATEHAAMSASTGIVAAFKPPAIQWAKKLLGEDQTNRLLGLRGTNVLNQVITDSSVEDMIRSGGIEHVTGDLGVALTPTARANAMRVGGGVDANIGKTVEMMVERQKPFLTHLSPEEMRDQTLAKVAAMGGDVTQAGKSVGYDEAALTHALYYDHAASSLVDDVTPDLRAAAEDGTLPTDLAELPARATMVGERTLTNVRAQPLEAAIKAGDATAVRSIIDKYDDFNWIDGANIDVSKDGDLLDLMGRWLETNREGLLSEVPLKDPLTGALRGDLPPALARWADEVDQFGYGLALAPPADLKPETLLRLTRDKEGRILNARPWLDYTSEASAVVSPGRLGSLRIQMFRQIRGERILWQNRRRFVQAVVRDNKVAPKVADRIFVAVMYAGNERAMTPRGLLKDEMFSAATDVLKKAGTGAGTLTPTELVKQILVAYKGDLSQVGLTQALTGAVKATTPGSNWWGRLAERLYPQLKFALNPMFLAQEYVEPYILGLMRGIRTPLDAKGKDFARALAVRQAFMQVTRGSDEAALEMAEYQKLMVLTSQAVHEAVQQDNHGLLGRLRESYFGNIQLRKAAAEGLQTKQLFGRNLRVALTEINGPDYWPELERHFATTDAGDIAFNYLAEQFHIAGTNGERIGAIEDMMAPFHVGSTARIQRGTGPGVRWSHLSSYLGRVDDTDGEGLIGELKSGTLTREAFMAETDAAKIDPVFAQRAYHMATGPEVNDFYTSLGAVFGAGTKKAQKERVGAYRSLIQARAKTMNISEEEFIKTHFRGIAELRDEATLVGPGLLYEVRPDKNGFVAGLRYAPWGASSKEMTGFSAQLMRLKGYTLDFETSSGISDESANAALRYLEGIHAAPGSKVPVWSGQNVQGSRVVPKVGESIDLPLTATDVDPGVATSFSRSRDYRVKTPGFVYEFPPGTKGVAHGGGENVTAGKFVVDSIERRTDADLYRAAGRTDYGAPGFIGDTHTVVKLRQVGTFDPSGVRQDRAIAAANGLIEERGRLADEFIARHGGSYEAAQRTVGERAAPKVDAMRSRVGSALLDGDRERGVVRRVMDEPADDAAGAAYFDHLAVSDPDRLRAAAPGDKAVEKAIQSAAASRPRARTPFVNAEGKTTIWGEATGQDLLQEALDWMPEADGLAAGQWYPDIRARFQRAFGTDADTMMLAFAVSQASTSPIVGMTNVMRAVEQVFQNGFEARVVSKDIAVATPKRVNRFVIDRATKLPKQLSSQLNEENIIKALMGAKIDRNFGPKLNDFLDSILGNTSRRWTGRVGDAQPAAIDRWTARDIGYIDDVAVTHLAAEHGTPLGNGVVQIKDASGAVFMNVRKGEKNWELVDEAGRLVDKEGNVLRATREVPKAGQKGGPVKGFNLTVEDAATFGEGSIVNPGIRVRVTGPDGKKVGRVYFFVRDGELVVDEAAVEEAFQRKGIANWMYAEAEARLGLPIRPGKTQSPDARKFWKQADRPFGNEDAFAPPQGVAAADFTDAPNAYQYEHGIKVMNEQTALFNEYVDPVTGTQGVWGRTDWTAADVQAVGWMKMQRIMGGAEETGGDAFVSNSHIVATEVAAETGSDWAHYAPQFDNLAPEQVRRVTGEMNAWLAQQLRDEFGVTPIVQDWAGPARWQGGAKTYSAPSIWLSTPESADDIADITALVFRQREVWVPHVVPDSRFDRLTSHPVLDIAHPLTADVHAAEQNLTALADALDAPGATLFRDGDGRLVLRIIDDPMGGEPFLARMDKARAAALGAKTGMADPDEVDRLIAEAAGRAGIDAGTLEQTLNHADVYKTGPARGTTVGAQGASQWETHLEDATAALRNRGRTVREDALGRLRDAATVQLRDTLERVARESGDDVTATARQVSRGEQLADRRAGSIFGFTESVDDGRALIGATRRADAVTGLHELGHVFARDLDQSLRDVIMRERANLIDSTRTDLTARIAQADAKALAATSDRTRRRWSAQANALRNDLGTLVPEEGWGVQHEEFFVDQFHKWIKNGQPPVNSELGRAFEHFRNWLGTVWDTIRGRTGDKPSEAMEGLFNDMFSGHPPVASQNYSIEQQVNRAAAKQALQAAQETAFSTQYFKQGRSFMERSINHPFVGLYPFSYMWGKVLPEMFQFLALRPFGMAAPMVGWNAVREANDTISMKKEMDPAFKKWMEDNKRTFSLINTMFPALPNDVPFQAPLWARRIAEQGLQNSDRVAAGQQAHPVDYSKGIADQAQYIVGPLQSAKTLAEAIGGVGDLVRGALGMPQPKDVAKSGGSGAPPVVGSTLTPP